MEPSDEPVEPTPEDNTMNTAADFTAAPAAHSAASSRVARLAALGHCLLERLETPLFVADAQGTVR